MTKPEVPVLFRLTYCQSEDGHCTPTTLRYTKDDKEARKHLEKLSRNPYAAGAVYIIENGFEKEWK